MHIGTTWLLSCQGIRRGVCLRCHHLENPVVQSKLGMYIICYWLLLDEQIVKEDRCVMDGIKIVRRLCVQSSKVFWVILTKKKVNKWLS